MEQELEQVKSCLSCGLTIDKVDKLYNNGEGKLICPDCTRVCSTSGCEKVTFPEGFGEDPLANSIRITEFTEYPYDESLAEYCSLECLVKDNLDWARAVIKRNEEIKAGVPR